MNKNKSLSAYLWSLNEDLAKASLHSIFVQGIKTGNLPLENFQEYIAQDAYFLDAFAKGYGLAIAKSNNRYEIRILSELLAGVVEELSLHDQYSAKWDVDLNEKSLGEPTLNYIDFLLSTASIGTIKEIISAMVPCLRLYSWIGKELNQDRELNNPYNEWINTYGSPSFEELSLKLESLLNNSTKREGEANIEFIYRRAMKLELNFFQSNSPQ